MATNGAVTKRYAPVKADTDGIEALVRMKYITSRKAKKASKPKDMQKDLVEGAVKDPIKAALAKEKKKAQQKIAKRKKKRAADFLVRRIGDRLAHRVLSDIRQPTDVIEKKMRKHKDTRFGEVLKELPTDKITGEQLARLKDASELGPNHLGRTVSLTPGFHWTQRGKWATNGFTTEAIMMPAADTNQDQATHVHISRMPQGRIIYMAGHHLIWTDAPADELLSYSKDFLFLIIHALCRHEEGQGGVSILIVDRRNAMNATGKPAAFFPALEFGKAVEVWKWKGWTSPQQGALSPRKFTHEFLSHGTILVDDDQFVQAPLEELIELGLFELFPYFNVPKDGWRRYGLYTSEVACRKVGYPPTKEAKARGEIYSYGECAEEWALDLKTLQLVQKLTRLFTRLAEDDNDDEGEPHLHAFLGFLTFQKRPRRDPAFIKWIRTHYSAQDVIDLYDDGHGGVRPGFTNVANNLPGYMQYLDLVRDAQWALGILTELPPNVVEIEIAMIKEKFKDTDDKEQRQAEIGFQCDEWGLMLGSRASEAKKKDVEAEREKLKANEQDTLSGNGSSHAKAELSLLADETAVVEDETALVDDADSMDDDTSIDSADEMNKTNGMIMAGSSLANDDDMNSGAGAESGYASDE